MQREIWVAQPCLAQLYAQLDKINAKARKYELPELTATELNQKVVRRTIDGNPVQVTAILVRIEGATVRAGPWSLIASMNEQAGTRRVRLFRQAPVLTDYLSEPMRCEHCNTNRARKRTFIVLHDVDGFSRQVGHTCLHDYTGITLGQVAAGTHIQAYLNALEEKAEQWLDSPQYFERLPHRLQDVLTLACAAIRSNGWHRAKDVDGVSTASDVRCALARPELLEVLDADREEAQRALAQAQAHYGPRVEFENDFEARVHALLRTQQVLDREIGVAAWLAYRFGGAYVEPTVSEHVGRPGMRIETNVRVSRIADLGVTKYGPLEIITLTDEAGNQLVWKTGRRPREMREGTVLAIKGTVKKHTEYRGVAQTEVNRVTVQPSEQPLVKTDRVEVAAPAAALSF